MTNQAVVIPPQDVDIERAVLGIPLREELPDALEQLVTTLEPEDFAPEYHRVIFTAMRALRRRGGVVDLHTLACELRGAHELGAVGGLAYLEQLFHDATIAAHLPEYMKLVREFRVKRETLAYANQLACAAANGVKGTGLEDVLGTARVRLEALCAMRAAADGATVPWPILDAADEWPGVLPPALIVERLLPKVGVVWWGGLPKRYKSLLLLYVCLSIAAGRDTVAGRLRIVERPRILYVAREDGEDRVNARRADIVSAWRERPETGRLRFLIRPALDLMDGGQVDALRRLCLAHGITLLVLDTWTALSPTADPLGSKDQAALAAIVVKLAADIDGTIVVVDHSRKNRPDGAPLSSADIFGPPQKWAAAEHLVMLGDTENTGRIEVFIEGKDVDSGRFFLDVSARGSATEKFTYAGSVEELAEERRALGEANRQAVLEVLRKSDAAMSVGDLTAALETSNRKMSKATVQRHLAALIEAEKVRQTGAGRSTQYLALDFSPHEPSAVVAVIQGAANG